MRKKNNTALKSHLEKNYGISAISINPTKRGILNENYIVRDANGLKYVFKVYKLRKPELVDFEISVLRKIKKHDFPAPHPIISNQGKYQHTFGDKPAVLFVYIEGNHPKHMDASLMYRAGELLATFHNITSNLSLKYAKDSWEPVDMEKYITATYPRMAGSKIRRVGRAVPYITNEMNGISFTKTLPKGITHQDVRRDNILIDGSGKIHLIDFDNMYKGVLLYDVATPIIWECFNNGRIDKKLLRAYLSGYQSKRMFTSNERKHFFDAIRFRLLREAYTWPMRFDSYEAVENLERFLKNYHAWKSLKGFTV